MNKFGQALLRTYFFWSFTGHLSNAIWWFNGSDWLSSERENVSFRLMPTGGVNMLEFLTVVMFDAMLSFVVPGACLWSFVSSNISSFIWQSPFLWDWLANRCFRFECWLILTPFDSNSMPWSWWITVDSELLSFLLIFLPRMSMHYSETCIHTQHRSFNFIPFIHYLLILTIFGGRCVSGKCTRYSTGPSWRSQSCMLVMKWATGSSIYFFIIQTE